MENSVDERLFKRILSQHKPTLATAIGRRLVEVERFFSDRVTPEGFVEEMKYRNYTVEDFFSHNAGNINFYFEGGLIHSIGVYGEHLSLLLMEEPFTVREGGWLNRPYRLSETVYASDALKACLNQECHDVRIWTYAYSPDYETTTANEAGLSYLLADGHELIYCIYMHEYEDDDWLLIFADQIRPESVASCYSLKEERYLIVR